MLFSSSKKDSLYPASLRCRATMELSPHPNDVRVRLVDMSVPCQTPSPILKDAFLTELVIRHVRNRFLFHPLLQLIERLRTSPCPEVYRSLVADSQKGGQTPQERDTQCMRGV